MCPQWCRQWPRSPSDPRFHWRALDKGYGSIQKKPCDFATASDQPRGTVFVSEAKCSTVLVYGPSPSNPNFLDEDHPLNGLHGAPFVDDKIDVEQQVRKYADEQRNCCVTVLRMAPILGPTIRNYVVRWLSRRLVPTVMGHDPLIQFLHEVDAVAALKLALDREVPGAFNIVGDGVLPISTVVRLAGRLGMPIPYPFFKRLAGLLWVAQLSEAPPSFVAALRYLCVADGARARTVLGFRPVYTSRDAVLDFEGALRLREARLLNEAT